MIFESHAHYDDEAFDEDREELLTSLKEHGIGNVINVGASLAGCKKTLELMEKYPFLYGAMGVHPGETAELDEDGLAWLHQQCSRDKVVAVGEIGLDYYWKDNPPREFQQTVFRKQIELALELDLPVIVHDREAHQDSLNVVLDYPELRGVFHCFSGSPEMAGILLNRGWYLGFDGPITYKNAQKAPEVAAVTPLDRIVVETDSPYLSPAPLRGKRNDSRNLSYIIEKLAEWKGVSPEEMTRITWENGLRLFPKIGAFYKEETGCTE